MAARTATLWRLAQDWIDLETGALLCAAEDFACAGNDAAAAGGRWNSVARPVIYLADSLALAQLEKRVHTPMRPPRDLVAVEAIVPAGVGIVRLSGPSPARIERSYRPWNSATAPDTACSVVTCNTAYPRASSPDPDGVSLPAVASSSLCCCSFLADAP